MFNIKSKLKNKVMKNEDQRYFLVYQNQENEVKPYEIGRPDVLFAMTESFP